MFELTAGPMFEKYNLVLRFYTGASRYSAEELKNFKEQNKSEDGLPFLQRQCEDFHLGKWSDDGHGGKQWTWDNRCERATTSSHPTRSPH